jgi:mandelate racemase
MLSNLTIKSIAARAVLAPIPRPLRTASGDILAAPLALVDVQTIADVAGRR